LFPALNYYCGVEFCSHVLFRNLSIAQFWSVLSVSRSLIENGSLIWFWLTCGKFINFQRKPFENKAEFLFFPLSLPFSSGLPFAPLVFTGRVNTRGEQRILHRQTVYRQTAYFWPLANMGRFQTELNVGNPAFCAERAAWPKLGNGGVQETAPHARWCASWIPVSCPRKRPTR
jgi:hypothetical protein